MAYTFDLKPVSTKEQLLTYIGLDERSFDSACSFDEDSYKSPMMQINDGAAYAYARQPFLRHAIPKKNPFRGKRIVWEADEHLNNAYKGLARRLNRFFQSRVNGFPHPRCFGYVIGRNIRENAALHVGAHLLLKTDIREFFPSISQERVKNLFIDLGVTDLVAEWLSEFLTIGGKLPLGLPTSPVIANVICFELDVELFDLANSKGSQYSRYADDLSFSTNCVLPKVSEVEEVIEKHGFKIARDKTRVSKRGQNHYVTGLSISDRKFPHAPRSLKRRLRQELHYSKKFGLRDHIEKLGITTKNEVQQYINHLDGCVKYVAFHESKISYDLFNIWNEILELGGEEVSFKPKNDDRSILAFVVDETEFTWGGSKYLALGMSVSRNQETINQLTENLLRNYLANPFSDGNLDALHKNRMHFSDATEDLRLSFVRTLQFLPFQGYIFFGKQTGDFESDYLRLLNKMIKRRLIAADGKLACFLFEQSSKVSKTAVAALVHQSCHELARSNNRRPEVIKVEEVTKSYYGVSVPDFLLAVFRKFILSGPIKSPPQREHNMFEGLRDKIRIIVNADTGEEFTRRNPFEICSMPDVAETDPPHP